MAGTALLWDLIARDKASPAFMRVAGAADKAAASTARATKGMQASVARMGAVGATLTKHVTLPIAALGAVSVAQAAKWQKSMTLIQTAGGETAAKAAELSTGLKKLATETGTSLDALGEGIYTVAKAGGKKWSANDQLLIMKAAAQGAKAENVDLGTATNALTSVMMSYHLGADKAVATQNELVVGAGLAKTTMQNYAAALSTVVPVASAAGIGFDQVAGAIATMTQHGTSADEATQELSHTIRNLLGPNQVAQKAMQQLGLSVTDVTKNLGTRGLTGTIDLITNAISKKMGPAGMVVTSVFKKSQAATADLNSMMKVMPDNLSKVSQGLLGGKVGIKEYTADVKALGGTAGAQGLQFLSLYKSSQGFNDLLKSGQPQARTFAGALKQVLGTATSMNTALQLGGENSDYFKTATNEVAKAAKESGADVLGWAKTQNTLSVKLDKAKASLQVMAVEIGTALIPAVSKIVEWVSKAVHWFDSLSSTKKKFIGYSALVLAALGPVLAILARVGKLFTLIWRGSVLVGRGFGLVAKTATSSAATVAEAQAAETAAVERSTAAQMIALRRLSSARAYAARQARVSATTSAAQSGAATRGGVGAAPVARGAGRFAGAGAGLGLAGLLGGAAIGGQQGTARGATSSALMGAGGGALIGSMIAPGIGTAIGAGVGGLAGLLKGMGVFGGVKHTDAHPEITKELASLKEYQRLSAGAAKVTYAFQRAILAGGSALKTNQAAVANAAIAQSGLAKSAADAGLTTKDLAHAVTGSQAAFDKVMNYWAKSGTLTADDTAAMRKLRDEFTQGKAAAQKYADVHGLVIAGQMKTVKQTQFLSGALGNLNRQHLTGQQVGRMFRSELDNLTTSVTDNGRTLDRNSGFGQRNIAVIRELSARALQHAQAVYQQTGSVEKADRAFRRDKKSIEGVGTAAGLNKGAVDKIVTSIANVKSKHVKMTVDTTAARDALNTFSGWYDGLIATLSDKTIHAPRVVGGGGTINTPGNAGVTGRVRPATGGYIVGPGTGTSDSIPAMVSNGEYVINAKQTAKHLPLLNAINRGVRGYAKGGPVGGTLGGVHYKTDSDFKSALHGVTTVIAAMMSAAKNVLATASDLASAAKDLRASAREQKASAAVQSRLARESTRLVALGRRRDAVRNRLGSAPTAPTAYERLATAQQNYGETKSGVASAVSGFDITTAGVNDQVYSDRPAAPVSAGSILTQIKAAAAKATKFAALIRKLGKEGLNRSLLMQLANAGPGAYDQAAALAAATPAQLKSVNAAQSQLTAAGNSAGKYVADKFYGAGVKSAQGYVDGLKSQQKMLDRQIKTLGSHMAHELESALGIGDKPKKKRKKPASHINVRSGHHTAAAANHNKRPATKAEAAALKRKHSGDTHIHVHGIEDPVTFARRAETEMVRKALAGL